MSTIKCFKPLIVAGQQRQLWFFSSTCVHKFWNHVSNKHLHTTTRCLASKDVFIRNKEHFNVGTVGHHQHGKTCLTSAITKVLSEENLCKFLSRGEIDKSKVEVERGISINVCHLEYESGKRHYTHTDTPGHLDYVKNTSAGISEMDSCILVISAEEGCMPQTRDHLIMAKVAGLKNVVVFINKTDKVDREMADVTASEVREILSQLGFDGENTPVIQGSALCALEDKQEDIGKSAIKELIRTMDELEIPTRDLSSPFFLPIAHANPVPGGGKLMKISGMVLRGRLAKGTECELLGYGHRLKCVMTECEIFNKQIDEVVAGDQFAGIVKGVREDDVKRGMVCVKPGTVKMHERVEAEITVLSKDEGGGHAPLRHWSQPSVFSQTWSSTGILEHPDEADVMPGETATVIINLDKQMPLGTGWKFHMRNGSHLAATGVVNKVLEARTEAEKAVWAKERKKKKKVKKEQEKMKIGAYEGSP